MSFSAFSQFTDSVLLHRSATSNRRDITVSRNSLARCNARHLRIKHSVPFISVGPVYHNALTCCAALSCRTLRKENHLCSSTVSDTANMRIHERSQAVSAEEKILCRSPFAAVTCRQSAPDYPKGNGEKIRGVETLVSIPLVRPRGVSAVPFASQAKTQIASWKVREITSRCCSRLSL